jgi:predicted ATPase/DNA-binding CsgD family transcriptional regulator
MIHHKPVVTENTLCYQEQGHEQTVSVGTPAWYAWLQTARAFTYRTFSAQFTARCERASNGRGDWYWKAYRRQGGKLRTAYLGKAECLSPERLQAVAATLEGYGPGSARCAEPATPAPARQQDGKDTHSSVLARRVTSPLSLTQPPLPPTILIGRAQEMQTLTTLLLRPEVHMLTLTGPGGVGKTRLALAVAEMLRAHFADGVCFVPLASVSKPERVIPTIAQALGLWEAGNRSPLKQLQTVLRERHLLLLLDNFEQVITAATTLATLLTCCPGLHMLITSRAALRLSAEHDFAVPPLAIPDLPRLPASQDLAQIPTVALFLERAGAVQATFRLTRENALTVAAICARLEGLPLAVELAAARIKLLPPQALLQRLEHRLEVLTCGARDLPVRQQTLRNTIQWSYDLLTTEEQRLFRSLAVFSGGCTLEAISFLTRGANDPRYAQRDRGRATRLLEAAGSLLHNNLVLQTAQEGEEPRFGLLEIMREFGLERLREMEELEDMRAIHAAYYLRFAEEAFAHLFGAQAMRWFELLEREYENLHAVFVWALEKPGNQEEDRIVIAARLGMALWRFWVVRGRPGEGGSTMDQVLAASETQAPAVQAMALLAWGAIFVHRGFDPHEDYTQLTEKFRKVLRFCQHHGDQRGRAHTSCGLAIVAFRQGAYEAAETLACECLEASRSMDDSWWIATALVMLGSLASVQQAHIQARHYLEESLALFRALGYPGDLAWPLIYLAHDASEQGERARARSLLAEALICCRQAGNRWGLAHALSLLGTSALDQGDLTRAYTLLSECHQINLEAGHQRHIAHSLFLLARVDTLQGNKARAQHLYEQSLTLARASGHRGLTTSCLEALAALASAATMQKCRPHPAGLTAREGEVLRLVARGLTDAQVAEQLVISLRTVTTHLTSIYNKLGVSSRVAATRFALEHQMA